MVRRCREKDVPSVAKLFDAYRIFYRKPGDLPGAEIFLRARIRQSESVIFIHEQGSVATGFTQLYPLFSSTRMQRIWLLNDLFVLPEYRGQGISRQLIQSAQQHANETGAAGLLLETEKTNITANQLYPATGFEMVDNNFYWWEAK